MTAKNITEVVGTVVDELSPLSSEDRHKVIQASMTLLGESEITAPKHVASGEEKDLGQLPARAQTWMKQNKVTKDKLDQVFHIADGDVDIIAAEIPGKSTKEKTLNCYVLCGIGQLLSGGEPTFDDKSARALCESSGCYDGTNHSTYMKSKGNEIAGSKEKGWTLTGPGLKRAAELVAEASK